MIHAEDIDWVDVGGGIAEGFSITFLDDGMARLTLYKDDGTEVTWTADMTLFADDDGKEAD